ncbi:zinc finger protein 510-like [Malaya genurostris]|uniref:zinc finger protein 510-like n=1 Tax=Malaya genurostris TaxID=325434 RepID=UPI0026F381D0|nr:zinc finger protein 510-like [Malaya genurostris]
MKSRELTEPKPKLEIATVIVDAIKSKKKKSEMKKSKREDDQNFTNVEPISNDINALSQKEDSPVRKPWLSLDEPEFTPQTKRKGPKKAHKQKPKSVVEGPRVVIPRPWRRKFKEAAELSSEEYRQYVAQNTNHKQTIVICELCGRSVNINRMDGHRNRHLGLQPYECETCGDKFNCKLNLRIHWRRNHVQGEEVKCNVCGKLFVSKIALHSHEKYVHSERKHQCTLCPLKFFTRYALSRHMKIHNQTRDFKCPLCSRAFYCKSVWNIHMRTHSGETPYQCSVCSMAYVHRNMYVAHMQKNHPGQPLMYLSRKKSFKDSMMKKTL